MVTAVARPTILKSNHSLLHTQHEGSNGLARISLAYSLVALSHVAQRGLFTSGNGGGGTSLVPLSFLDVVASHWCFRRSLCCAVYQGRASASNGFLGLLWHSAAAVEGPGRTKVSGEASSRRIRRSRVAPACNAALGLAHTSLNATVGSAHAGIFHVPVHSVSLLTAATNERNGCCPLLFLTFCYYGGAPAIL